MTKAQWIKENLKADEIYAGILLGQNGEPDQHIILLPGTAKDVNWEEARNWAKKAGGDLPTRREQSLLFANLKGEFEPTWHWSGEQHASYTDYAWIQGFGGGSQLYDRLSNAGRARAVRRIPVEQHGKEGA